MTNASSRMPEPKQPRLGRGLAALLGESASSAEAQEKTAIAKSVPIEFIRASARNPRQAFDEAALEELSASIRERGMIQPIVVRASSTPGTFEIIAGERRWRAAQRAGLHTVPIVSLDANDQEALELSIIENVQRSDLNALEEAKGFSQLAAEYGYSHTDIGRVIGKSRSHVANTLRLLSLSPHVKTLLIKGDISSGHARALLTVENADEMADRIVAEGLTVREIEKNRSEESPSAPKAKAERENDPVTKDLENRISNALGTKVFIQNTKRSRELRIRFEDFDQLQYICDKLLQN